MNRSLLPEVFRGLPVPWSLSDSIQRRDALTALSATADQRSVALAALEHSLAFMAALGPDEDDDEPNPYPALNDPFDEAWIFFGKDLTTRMPTFRDADRVSVVAWLSSRRLGG
ncbi:hypothetical protein [Allonocardiopsis opalescens]|uniref:Uncharacterized protein n=1 Tax=Allonocardiopsis opalescens TaxID=1144618 RepID=A0A2T0PW26_9ACTN|nr:hypothetical protein [Allonocardiopsis opalescens]PRX95739.1 hypothetical protein CLV72_109352 [Allonocardiopsis opalescens]